MKGGIAYLVSLNRTLFIIYILVKRYLFSCVVNLDVINYISSVKCEFAFYARQVRKNHTNCIANEH